MTISHPPPFGLVLAGGLARRMGGGDKARIEIGGISILDRVLATLSAQCTGIVINANGDPKRFSDTGLTVVPDSVPDFAGPLAGILAGLDWLAAHRPDIADVASVPGDCPFLPGDLVARLSAARAAAGVPLACARSGDGRHPRVGLWRGAPRGPFCPPPGGGRFGQKRNRTARPRTAGAGWPAGPRGPLFSR